jgi:hypothetical protein
VPPVRSEQLVRRPYLQFCFHALYQDDDSIIVRVCVPTLEGSLNCIFKSCLDLA